MITINLLPSFRKEKIRYHRVSRFIIFYSIIILIMIGIFIGLLVVILFFLQKESASIEEEIQFKQKSVRTQELKALENQVEVFNGEILKLNKIQVEHIYYSQVLENFTTMIPEDIQIFTLNIKEDKDSKGELYRVDIGGRAKARENLLFFKEKLERSDNFQDLYLPLANLTERYDVDFTLSASLKAKALRKY